MRTLTRCDRSVIMDTSAQKNNEGLPKKIVTGQ